jgi:hypothetical protein
LIDRLGDSIGFFLRFYRADNASGDSDPRQVTWLDAIAHDLTSTAPRQHDRLS